VYGPAFRLVILGIGLFYGAGLKPTPHTTHPQTSSIALSLASLQARARNSDSIIATRGSSRSEKCFASS
jgi:hypothetical protein